MSTSGQTTDPKTGKIYRKQTAKPRSAAFVRLSAQAEEARVALVTYCNEKSYAYDISSGKTLAKTLNKKGETATVVVKGDTTLEQLLRKQQSAKKALKDYKSSHEDEFRPQPPGKQGKPKPPTMAVINKPDTTG